MLPPSVPTIAPIEIRRLRPGRLPNRDDIRDWSPVVWYSVTLESTVPLSIQSRASELPMIRSNHYERAFEEYLRALRRPYVAVDEQRRALVEETSLGSLKSLDFIVPGPDGAQFLIDVKGRRFPSGEQESGGRWENWCTREDPASLLHWESLFGPGYRGLLVFAYDVWTARAAREFDELFEYRDRQYAFVGIAADDYERLDRQRSPKWQTVSLPNRLFRGFSRPFREWITPETSTPSHSGCA